MSDFWEAIPEQVKVLYRPEWPCSDCGGGERLKWWNSPRDWPMFEYAKKSSFRNSLLISETSSYLLTHLLLIRNRYLLVKLPHRKTHLPGFIALKNWVLGRNSPHFNKMDCWRLIDSLFFFLWGNGCALFYGHFATWQVDAWKPRLGGWIKVEPRSSCKWGVLGPLVNGLYKYESLEDLFCLGDDFGRS